MTPPLEAEYAAWPICPSKAAIGCVVLHYVCARLGDVERTDQVDRDGAREPAEIHGAVLAEHASRAEDAGAIDHDIEAAQCDMRCIDVVDNLLFGGHVGTEEVCVVGTEFTDGACALVRVDIEQRNLRARRHQPARNAEPETRHTAGDDCLDVFGLHVCSRESVEAADSIRMEERALVSLFLLARGVLAGFASPASGGSCPEG